MRAFLLSSQDRQALEKTATDRRAVQSDFVHIREVLMTGPIYIVSRPQIR